MLLLIFLLGNHVAEEYPFTTLISHAPGGIWLIPGLILTLASLWKVNRSLLALNLVSFMFFGWLLTGVNIPWRANRSGEEGSFTLLTYNMMGGQGGFDKVLQIIRDNDPDIICLQEASVLGLKGFANSEIPGYYVTNFGGNVVASKVEPVSSQSVSLLPGYPPIAEVDFANGLKVVSVHLSHFTIEPVMKADPRKLPSHLQQIANQHEIEADILISRYAQQPGVILAGDFNSPPRGGTYGKLSKHFDDAFAHAGWLNGFTWPSQFPVQRIDYAFVSRVRILSARTLQSTVSNHLPVLFRFKLPAKP